MHHIMLAHGLLSYRRGGTGFPMLLLHGWGGSSRYWQYTLEHFAPTHSVYAPDLPGYGSSPPLNGDINSERMANIVVEFADRLHLAQFDLNAHSFGASVATYIAARWPERVRRLVLTCFSMFRNEFERRMIEQMLNQVGLSVTLWQPWLSFWHPWMGLWQSWLSLWRPQFPGYTPSIYQTMAWRFFYRPPTDEALLQAIFSDFLQMDQRTSLQTIMSALNPSIAVTLQEIAAPTLLVAASQDMIMPQYGVPMVEHLIPDCRLVWIDQCGHLPMLEKPTEYHQVMQGFLNADAPPPTST